MKFLELFIDSAIMWTISTHKLCEFRNIKWYYKNYMCV